MANITLLPSAKVPLVYDGDNTMTTEWYRFFWNVYGFTGDSSGAIPVNKGGTGLTSIGEHQLIIGNASGVFERTELIGSGITITYASGTTTLAIGNSGVTPGTYGSASVVGQFTVDTKGTLVFAQNVSIAIDASQIISGTIASARIAGSYTGITGVGTLTVGMWNADTIGTDYGGTGLTSFTSGGALYATSTTALTSGTLPVTAGGTGQTSYTNGQLLIGNTTGNTLTKATLTAGSGVTITNGAGSITISATGSGGTVTAVTGTSPVVSSGGTTPAISLATAYGDTLNPYASKTANYFLAAPNGSAGVPTFRAIVAADIPALSYVTSVSGTGTVNGITLTGTVTSSGSLTLGGTLSGIGNSQLTNSTISGVALGGNLFNLTAGTGVSFSTGTTYNGSAAITINATGTGGTVTSVAALTLGTTGTDLSSTVANSTTTPVITLNVPTASAVNRGALSAADWTTFNSKANAFTYTNKYIPYGQGTTTPNQSSSLQFDGTTLGVGGTLSAWSGAGNVLQILGGAVWGSASVLHSSLNTYFDGSVYKYIASSFATDHYQLNGTFVWRNTTSGTAGNTVTWTTGMTLDASNNLSITGTATANGVLLTGNTGTVTSVAASVPGFLSISGSPITTSGTLAISYSGNALPIANGGTGTSTAFVAGSVIFAGASGIYSQDNGQLFWDDTNNRLGIQTSSPTQPLTVNGVGRFGSLTTKIDVGLNGDSISSNGDLYIQTSTSNFISIRANFTQGIRIHASGGVSIANSTDPGANNLSVTGTGKFGTTVGVGAATPSASGAGISFPAAQSASTDVNTLDDYEEGTFTPTVVSTSGTITTVGATTGQYTKIGDLVTVIVFLPITTNGTGAGSIRVTNMPFTCNATASSYGAGREQNATGNGLFGYINAGTTSLYIQRYDGAYPAANGYGLGFTITYKV